MLLAPICRRSFDTRFNIDGVLSFSAETAGAAYLQVFRDGSIETVNATLLRPNNEYRIIPFVSVYGAFVNSASRIARLLEGLNVSPPAALMLTLVGVKGLAIHQPNHVDFPDEVEPHRFDRNVLTLPDVLLQNYDTDLPAVIRPVADSLWQAAGWQGCWLYDQSGQPTPDMLRAVRDTP